MESERRDILVRILEVVLEQLAFMFGEAAEKEELITKGKRYLHATMGFKGPQTGNLEVAIPTELGVVLACNILGIDEGEGVASEQIDDALKEFLNIICGQLLTTVYGEEPVFDPSIPEVREIDQTGWKELLDRPDTIWMMVEDLPLIAHASF